MNAEHFPEVPEQYSRIVQRAQRLLNTLEHWYLEIKPEHGETGFRERVFNRMNDPAIAVPEELILSTGEVRMEKVTELIELEGDTIPSDLWWIYGACAHVVASSRALNANDLDRAWELMCDAHTPTGAMLVTNRAEEILTKTIAGLVNQKRASNAAKGRHVKDYKLQAFAYDIVRAGERWSKPMDAVRMLEKKLIEQFAEDYHLNSPHRTIRRWLHEMPDRDQFFPKKRKRAYAQG
ncbi:hypothetical protein VLK31_20895 [Variovorax sp. H27-G14]|uniref:hypothetical protein n=1 Tax=Variovorax sp. H27-G14 TaxID=3111914 RepID=UPI0038FCB431